MSIDELYGAYAAMERLPVEGRAADAAAAKRRSESLARLDEKVACARLAAKATTEKLLADLRAEAHAATSLGAIPTNGKVASGTEPDVGRVRALREQLAALHADRSRAETELERLRSALRALDAQIEDEGRRRAVWRQAKVADVLTAVLGGVAVLVSLACGPWLLGVFVLAVGLVLVGLRLARGRSAMMLRAAGRRPAVGSHRAVRRGYVLTRCGWLGVGSLSVSLALALAPGARGVDFAVGPMAGRGVDASWFIGIVACLVVVVIGTRQQRGSR